MTIDLDDYMDSSLSSSPTHLWPPKKRYEVNKTPLGVPVYCWILLGTGLGFVILGTLGLYLVNLTNGPRILYLNAEVGEPADFAQCSFGQCTEFVNCKLGAGEKLKAFIQPIVDVVDTIWRDIPIRSMSKNLDVIMKIDQLLSKEEFEQRINKIFKILGEKLESITVLWPQNMRPYELDSAKLEKRIHLISEDFMNNIEDSVRTMRSRSDVTSDCWLMLDGKGELNVSAALFDQVFNVWKENADQILSFRSDGNDRFTENAEPPFFDGVTLVHPYVLAEVVKAKSQITCSHTPIQTISCAMSDSTCEKLEAQLCRSRSD
uniref:Conserved plasma membrane protein n=1 Tax=Bursaphelenchus xylophilus TaxID=6326 RepID=A0A1I7S2R9_BURXY